MTSLAAFERGYEQVFVKVAMTGGSAGTRQFNRGLLDGLLRTGCAAVNPDFYLRHGIWPGERRQCAAFPWTPTPADKIVIRDVVEQVLEGSSAILLHHIADDRSEEHTSELQSRLHLVCRLLLEKKKMKLYPNHVN